MKEISFPQMTGLTSPNPLTLVCTKKADGTTNLSTISWWMPLSFNPNLFAVAINHASHGGERIRETGEAVIAIPAVGCEPYILGCGSTNGGKVDKAEKMFSLCEEFDWVPVSMKNDWTTIYGDGVTKK